jgi:hypothetical protein
VPRTVAALVDDARHAGPLEGAHVLGEAAGDGRLVVHIGLWLDGSGRVSRARFRATTCAALIAYAEAACAEAERLRAATPPPAGELLAAVAGVHPVHHGRAELVASAFARAMGGPAPRTGAAP